MGVLNAIDACNRGDLVKLDAQKNGNGKIRIDVVDPEGSIFAELWRAFSSLCLPPSRAATD